VGNVYDADSDHGAGERDTYLDMGLLYKQVNDRQLDRGFNLDDADAPRTAVAEDQRADAILGRHGSGQPRMEVFSVKHGMESAQEVPVVDPREDGRERARDSCAEANRVTKLDERGEAQASQAQLPGDHVASRVSALSSAEFSSRLATILKQPLELEPASRVAGHNSVTALNDAECKRDVISGIKQSGYPELLRHEALDSPDERVAEQRSTPADVVNRMEVARNREATPGPHDLRELRRGLERVR
jgi:hypothetical protein